MVKVQNLSSRFESSTPKSMSQNLHFEARNDLELYTSRVFNTIALGYRIDPIGPEFIENLYALRILNSKVPRFRGEGAATPPSLEDLGQYWNSNSIIFGVFFEEILIGVFGTERLDDCVHLLFCHIDIGHQRKGVSSGVAAFAILTWVNLGLTSFNSKIDLLVPDRQEILRNLNFEIK